MTACRTCGCEGLTRHPVIHHFLCAYVGPRYDFVMEEDALACPKCRLALSPAGDDNEIVGYSTRCPACGREFGWEA